MKTLILLVSLLLLPQAFSCAIATRVGEEVVRGDEKALIIWDEEKSMQHFIRQASFRKDAKNFGFLVPTPNRPVLTEIKSSSLFDELYVMTEPEVITTHETGFNFSPFFLISMSSKSTPQMDVEFALKSASVVLLEEGEVDGLNHAILSAEKEEDLIKWLEDNKYPASPALRDWLTEYVKNGWYITAFKFEDKGKNSSSGLMTSTVSLSFKADQPFYPYREPVSDQENHTGSLDLFMLSANPLASVIEQGGAQWSAEPLMNAPGNEFGRIIELLSGSYPEGMLPQEKSGWLAGYSDTTSVRPNSELVFLSDAGATPFKRTMEETIPRKIWIPFDIAIVVALLAAIAIFLVCSIKKRAS